MQSKEFHLGDVLSVTTGRLLAPRGMEALYDLLNFMTDDDLLTRQLPRARQKCAPYLLQQHPQLANVVLEEVAPSNFSEVLEALCAKYGERLVVTRLPVHARENIDRHREPPETNHPDRSIRIEVPPAPSDN